MFPFKWTPLVLNIFDKNVKSQPEGREGIPQAFAAQALPAPSLGPGPCGPRGRRSAVPGRAEGGQAASAARPPRCLTTMDLLLLCILVLFCVNKVNTPFKLNAPPGDWMPDLGRRLSPGLQKGGCPGCAAGLSHPLAAFKASSCKSVSVCAVQSVPGIAPTSRCTEHSGIGSYY